MGIDGDVDAWSKGTCRYAFDESCFVKVLPTASEANISSIRAMGYFSSFAAWLMITL